MAKHIFEFRSVLAFAEKESFLRQYEETGGKKNNSKMIHFLSLKKKNSPLSLPMKSQWTAFIKVTELRYENGIKDNSSINIRDIQPQIK